MAAMRVPLWLKILWTVWVAVWAPLYWKQYGAAEFPLLLRFRECLYRAALWLESPLLFSCQATGLLIFQSLYTIDLLGAVLSGRHLIGGTEYMFDSGIPLSCPSAESVSRGHAAATAVGRLAIGL